MNRSRSRHGTLILPILAILAISANSCAESESGNPSDRSERSGKSQEEVSQTGEENSPDSSNMAETDVSFEEQVVRRYSLLMSRVPVADIDSIIQRYMKRDAQPREAGRKAQRDVEAYMDRQDSAVRMTVAEEFEITADSLERLIGRRGRKSDK